jgi:hypothetical protein
MKHKENDGVDVLRTCLLDLTIVGVLDSVLTYEGSEIGVVMEYGSLVNRLFAGNEKDRVVPYVMLKLAQLHKAPNKVCMRNPGVH